MPRRTLFWRLFPWVACIAIAALALAGVHGFRVISTILRQTIYEHLESEARLAAHAAIDAIVDNDNTKAQLLARSLGERANTRLTFISPDGQVLGDTEAFPASMDNHANRQEIQEAMAGGVGRSERYSITRKHTMMYVAVPIQRDGTLIGVSRAAKPLADVGQILSYVQKQFVLGILLIGGLAAVLTWILTRHILKPMEQLREAAGELERGNFEVDLSIEGSREVHALAQSMRRMRDEIHEKLKTIDRQANELGLILADMGDGVLAVDADCRILLINRAACRQLGVQADGARGTFAHERIRRSAVLNLLEQILEQDDALREELILRGDTDLILDAHATRLRDNDGQPSGALVVLRDMTPFRRMKQTMRTFVENASHELRTPVTAIKGFIETLIDSPPDDPEQADRFLKLALKHSARLEALTNDLLTLSRIERDAATEQAELTPEPLQEPLQTAVTLATSRWQKRGTTVELHVEDGLVAPIRRTLLEQAVQNLLDNAIKYSPPESTVIVNAFHHDGEIVIEVADAGSGIHPQHHPFLFNRFYRVDESRSRDLGGTGLGLAIVKHIARLHRGRVSLDSQPGKGSTFRIHLPEKHD